MHEVQVQGGVHTRHTQARRLRVLTAKASYKNYTKHDLTYDLKCDHLSFDHMPADLTPTKLSYHRA